MKLPVPVTAASKVTDCPVLISVTFVLIETEVIEACGGGGAVGPEDVPPPPQAINANVDNKKMT